MHNVRDREGWHALALHGWELELANQSMTVVTMPGSQACEGWQTNESHASFINERNLYRPHEFKNECGSKDLVDEHFQLGRVLTW